MAYIWSLIVHDTDAGNGNFSNTSPSESTAIHDEDKRNGVCSADTEHLLDTIVQALGSLKKGKEIISLYIDKKLSERKSPSSTFYPFSPPTFYPFQIRCQQEQLDFLDLEELFDLPQTYDVSSLGLGLDWILGILIVLETNEIGQQSFDGLVKLRRSEMIAIATKGMLKFKKTREFISKWKCKNLLSKSFRMHFFLGFEFGWILVLQWRTIFFILNIVHLLLLLLYHIFSRFTSLFSPALRVFLFFLLG